MTDDQRSAARDQPTAPTIFGSTDRQAHHLDLAFDDHHIPPGADLDTPATGRSDPRTAGRWGRPDAQARGAIARQGAIQWSLERSADQR